MAFSIAVEKRGIHLLLWTDYDDLYRALLIVYGALQAAGLSVLPTGIPVADNRHELNRLFQTRIGSPDSFVNKDFPHKDNLWILFIPQAGNQSVGPWLNGWRRALSHPPGSLLVVRYPDFDDLQRNAPDLFSFVGPRIYNAGAMVSLFSENTYAHMSTCLPEATHAILESLRPGGTLPSQEEIKTWMDAYTPKPTHKKP